MIRTPYWLGAMSWLPALVVVALAPGALAPTALESGVAQAGAHAAGPELGSPRAGFGHLTILGSSPRAGRRPSEARPARTRRCQGSGPQGLAAPAVVAVAPLAAPASPLELEPPAACVRDPLDPCTRSPRPPPQA